VYKRQLLGVCDEMFLNASERLIPHFLVDGLLLRGLQVLLDEVFCDG